MHSNNLMKNAVCSAAILSLGFPFFSLENIKHSQMHPLPFSRRPPIINDSPITVSGPAIMESSANSVSLPSESTKDNSAEPVSLPKKQYQFAISTANDYVYIRKKPTTKSKELGRLYKGSVAKILKKDKSWFLVKSNSITGYVKKDFLKTTHKIDRESSKNTMKNIVVQAKKLNVRNKKSVVGEVVTQISEGTQYQVVKEANDWIKIKINNTKTGYVAKKYVAVQEVLIKTISMQEKKMHESSEVAKRAIKRVEIVNYAMQFLGNPYVYGGTSLTNGIDCSAFTQAILRKFGINIPRTSREQARAGKEIAIRDVAAGDLIFYSNGERINHVVLCIGEGKVVSASNPRHGIRICNINYRTPICARRVLY